VAVELLPRLRPVRAVRARERPVAVHGDHVTLQLGVGPMHRNLSMVIWPIYESLLHIFTYLCTYVVTYG
jgi:hypothetical protein